MREIESAIGEVLSTISSSASEGNEEAHRARVQAALTVLDLAESTPAGQAWLKLVGRLAPLAHRRGLTFPRPVDPEFLDLWEDFNVFLDGVLDRLEARFLEIDRVVRDIAAKAVPTSADATKLVSKIPHHPVAQALVFDRLGNDWLPLFIRAGAFDHPPDPVADETGKRVSFPNWGPSRYLARVAAGADPKAQDDLLRAVTAIPVNGNMVVADFLFEALSLMDGSYIAQAVPRLVEWLACPYPPISSTPELSEMVVKLAEGKEPRAALDLAGAVLRLEPDPRVKDRNSKEESFPTGAEIQSRLEPWAYGRFLEATVPALTALAPQASLAMLVDMLESALELSLHEPRKKEDYSYVWRPEIEEPRESMNAIRNALVSAVYQSCSLALAASPERISEVIADLERRPWPVLRRVALQLLREHPRPAGNLIEQHLLRFDEFDSPDFQREYRLLLSEHFGGLSEGAKGQIYASLSKRRDEEKRKEGLARLLGRPPSDHELLRDREEWLLRRLRPIAEHLTNERRDKYDDLVSRYGTPPVSEPTVRTTAWFGPASSKSAEELAALDDAALIGFLQTWKEPAEPFGPSADGLSGALAQATTADPNRFSQLAPGFMGLDWFFVSGLLEGLHGTVRRGLSLDWEPVLRLCEWAVKTLEGDDDTAVGPFNRRPKRWTRMSIATLLSAGLEVESAQIPSELRETVWRVLQSLTDDPDPSLAEEQRVPPESSMDPATSSLNRIRGQAMHGVVHYARWVQRQQDSIDKRDAEEEPRGFERMPEVRAVLDAHLDLGRDRSRAVRSVYGRWFPYLVHLDRKWAEANVSQIFPSDETATEMWRAAWDAFVIFGPAHRDVFGILEGEYSRAVDRMGSQGTEQRSPGDPDVALGKHLVDYAAGGTLLIGPAGGLLERFFRRASPELGRKVLNDMGFRLYHALAVSSDVLTRLNRLWERQLERAESGDEAAKEQCSAYGWSFAAKHFDSAWSLKQLARVLSMGIMVKPDSLVVDRLADLVSQSPRDVLQRLADLLMLDIQGWLAPGWREPARAILEVCLTSKEDAVRTAATDLINRFAAKGILEFRDLLEPSNS